MFRIFITATMLVLLSIFFVPRADAGNPSAEDLHGRWAIDAEDCSSPDSEYMVFRSNGTFENTRTGQAEIVGFWQLDEDTVDLHMVTSPAYFNDLHGGLKDFEGIYNYFHAKVIIFNNKKDSHEAIGVIGNEVKRMKTVKCR